MDLNKSNVFLLGNGKLPPQDVAVERLIISSILNEKYCQNAAFSLIKTSDIFFKEAHRLMFEELRNIFENDKPISTKYLFSELKKSGKLDSCGGIQYVTEIINEGTAGFSIDKYIKIIQEHWIRRNIISFSAGNITSGYDETVDVFDMIENVQKQLIKISAELSIRKSLTGRELVKESLNEIQEAMKSGGLRGLDTGWKDWNQKLGGWKGNNLIIIAGRPGMGKTALALAAMKNVILRNGKCLFFSLEMSPLSLMSRLIASESSISYSKMDNGRISEEELIQINNSVNRLITDNIEIDDTASISVAEIRSKSMIKKSVTGLELIIVDYLQLVKGKGGNREQEIANITGMLKSLSKELNIPVIALAQLSRAVESRGGDKRPQLSDLRESGAIEQDADIVIFPYRPEYYGIKSLEDGSSASDLLISIVAKNRGGSTGEIYNYCKISTNTVLDQNIHNEYRLPDHVVGDYSSGKDPDDNTTPF